MASEGIEEKSSTFDPSKVDVTKEINQTRDIIHQLQQLCPRDSTTSAHSVERRIQAISDDLVRNVHTSPDTVSVYLELTLARHTLVDLCMQNMLSALSTYSPGLSQCMGQIRAMYVDVMTRLPGFVAVAKDIATPIEAAREDGTHKIAQLEGEIDELMKACDALQQEAESHTEEILQLRTRLRIYEQDTKETAARNTYNTDQPHTPNSAKKAVSPQRITQLLQNETYDWRQLHSESLATSQSEGKYLPIKLLKDLIEQIYASKEKADARNISQGLCPETLKEHMYVFLKNKYGVRSLIIENAGTILRSIRKFEQTDNDVAVVAKVFDCVVEDDFRLVQARLKESFADLLRAHIRSQHPMRTDDVIEQMVMLKQQGELGQEEWSPIITYMYEPDDSEVLHEQLLDLVRMNHQRALDTIPQGSRAEMAAAKELILQGMRSGCAPYSKILQVTSLMKGTLQGVMCDDAQILLDYQLCMHEEHLQKFHNCFKSVDQDNDGEINEKEFMQLVCATLNGFQPEADSNVASTQRAQQILESLDPDSHNRFTYSLCVKVLVEDIQRGQVVAHERVRQEAIEREAKQLESQRQRRHNKTAEISSHLQRTPKRDPQSTKPSRDNRRFATR